MTTFTDDFNRANSSSLGAGWVEVSGDWSIVSNQLAPGTSGATIVLRAATAMATSDNYAQVTIAATTALSQGVWCRGNSDLTSGYLWRNNGTNWTLFSVAGETFTSIGSFSAAAAPGDVAKIQAVGSTIKGFVNGVQRVSVTDTSVATGTSVGIRSDSTSFIRFDDFAAGDVTAGVTLGTASATETSQPLTGAKGSSLSTAAETDTAQPVTGARTAALTSAGGQETGQALNGGKTTSLGTAGDTEAAQLLIGSKTSPLPTAAEEDAAQALTGVTTAPLAAASESEAAQAVAGTKTGTAGTAGSSGSAQPLTGVTAAALGSATEEETAQSLAGGTPVTLALAGEDAVAQPLTGAKTAVSGVVLEGDAARPLVVPSDDVPSLERMVRVLVEGRRLAVAGEVRTFVVTADHRTVTVR